MSDEFTNLLPRDRRHELFRAYHMRLIVVAVWFGSALLVAIAVLLLPTYLFLSDAQKTENARLSSIAVALASSDEAVLSKRLAVLSRETSVLGALSDVRMASAVIKDVLALPRPGVKISQFSYTPQSTGKPGTLSVFGTAATRDVLRAYQLALQGAPFARSAALPVSAYAKDANIDFSIVITLAP